jgi:hypothetical protein
MHPDLKIAQMYCRKWQSCRAKGLDFELSFAQFKKLHATKRCAYTDVLMTKANGEKVHETDRTIDRIDASRGYVPGNVVACCDAANRIKGGLEAPGQFMNLERTARMLGRIRDLLS